MAAELWQKKSLKKIASSSPPDDTTTFKRWDFINWSTALLTVVL
jgi:hypothetical protein